MAEEWTKRVIGRLGRRGTIGLGVVLGALFLMSGGPLFLAGASTSVVGVLVFAGILVGPAVWVLADARKRGMARPFLWALFALLGSVVGAIVYLLVRDDQPTQRPCGACGKPVSSAHSACPWCGSVQARSTRTCGSCHNELEIDWRFCPYCRSEVGRATPTT